jgi:hypothetical protein
VIVPLGCDDQHGDAAPAGAGDGVAGPGAAARDQRERNHERRARVEHLNGSQRPRALSVALPVRGMLLDRPAQRPRDLSGDPVGPAGGTVHDHRGTMVAEDSLDEPSTAPVPGSAHQHTRQLCVAVCHRSSLLDASQMAFDWQHADTRFRECMCAPRVAGPMTRSASADLHCHPAGANRPSRAARQGRAKRAAKRRS